MTAKQVVEAQKKEMQVDAALSGIDVGLKRLEERIAYLYKRLDRVMRNEPSAEPEEEKMPSVVELAQRIIVLASTLDKNNRSLDDILARLEI